MLDWKEITAEGRLVVEQLKEEKELIWFNPERRARDMVAKRDEKGLSLMTAAADLLQRFAPWVEDNYPQSKDNNGLIESPLQRIDKMKEKLDEENKLSNLFLKRDDILPISGSIKARGGIYEILKLAETIALEEGRISLDDNYALLSSEENKRLFSQYSVAVGSTGNLGLSVGIISAKLGFQTTVHMSSDAREWKKDKLRAIGVNVIEYEDDYSRAVAEGRKAAAANPLCHFVDDENSEDLFMGYSVAALRLKDQLLEQNIEVDDEHPLFVYIPCGVGTGPGGVAWGLNHLYGANVYVFFAEPVASPSVLLGLASGLKEKISVYDIGLLGRTEADGLAVARPSGPVLRKIESTLAGCLTITDEHLYRLLFDLAKTENILLEPSALAAMTGPYLLHYSAEGRAWLKENKLEEMMAAASHIVWATGGSMVPDEEMKSFLAKGMSYY